SRASFTSRMQAGYRPPGREASASCSCCIRSASATVDTNARIPEAGRATCSVTYAASERAVGDAEGVEVARAAPAAERAEEEKRSERVQHTAFSSHPHFVRSTTATPQLHGGAIYTKRSRVVKRTRPVFFDFR